ncbi:M15 family metallopeptidase [Verrucomicrobium spinosum]|uniref:M15 family metallopeptidase n=1 Tax=Verrucomicrobium spinosum TaxID=2736 RepID=UPI001C436C20|nr:M15 family metallopeptidase [Verrucomicrobium spinosum]
MYAQGRTAPGSIVTKARGGYSNHNFGIAFDIGVFEGTEYIGESPKYAAVAAIAKDLGLEWGGDWKSIQDQPHFQLRPVWALGMKESVMLAQLRARVAAGKPIFDGP